MDALERRIALSCGVSLAVQEYGARDGQPIFFFHGWPSSRWQGAMLAAAAEELGIRLIAPDRPGIGYSSPQANRRLLDWPPLFAELAAALEIKECRVVGISGGGPYTLACAWALPGLVTAAATICGAPPLADSTTFDGLTPAYRRLLTLHRHHREATRWLFRLLHPLGRIRPPQWMLRLLRGAVRGPDAVVLSDPRLAQLCYEGFQGAWGPYRDGVFEDAEIYAQPWGFPLHELRQPVYIWHGLEDHNFSAQHAQALADQIPNCTLQLVPDEGHYSLPLRHARDILTALLAAK